jgi:hypothetical protein
VRDSKSLLKDSIGEVALGIVIIDLANGRRVGLTRGRAFRYEHW